MTTLSITLPKAMKEFVESEAKAGGYQSATEYVRGLLREERKRAALRKLERKLLDGLQSGEPIPVNREFWSDLDRKLKQRAASRQSAGSRRVANK